MKFPEIFLEFHYFFLKIWLAQDELMLHFVATVIICVHEYMARFERIIQKFKESPESLHFRDIEKILYLAGYVRIPAKGSHIKFKKEG